MKIPFLPSRKPSEAEVNLKALQIFRKDPDQDLIKLCRQHGLDVAASYAYRYFGQFLDRFRREMELQSREYNPENAEVLLLIVVPDISLGNETLYTRFTQDMSRLAHGCGFTKVQKVVLKSPSVVESAHQLSDVLQAQLKAGQKIILVSHSFSSATARLALDNLNPNLKSLLKGWINFSGLIFGSPKYFLKKQDSLLGTDLRSYSSEQKYFLKPMNMGSLRSYHFLAMASQHQLSIADQRKRQSLKAWGANDGFISFETYKRAQGTVVPVWGQGPFMSLEPIHGIVAKTLCSLVCPVPSKISPTPSLNTGYVASSKA